MTVQELVARLSSSPDPAKAKVYVDTPEDGELDVQQVDIIREVGKGGAIDEIRVVLRVE
jgi:hypothetical protein